MERQIDKLGDLKDIKESNLIKVTEYAVANRIAEEPAFKWWVSNILKHRNHIISKVKSRYWQTTHKFGIKLPHSVEEALKISGARLSTRKWPRSRLLGRRTREDKHRNRCDEGWPLI